MSKNSKNYDSIVSVSQVEESHPDFCYKLGKNNTMISYNLKNKKSQPRRQDVTRLFFCDGSLYVSCAASFKKYKSFFHKKTLGKIMPKWKSLEIDDYIDYIHAEATMKNINKILSNEKNNFQKRLLKAIPGGAHTYSRGYDQYPSNAPEILTHGKGAYVFDSNKDKYLDYGMALRAINIGYSEKIIDNAVIKHIKKGNNLTRHL